ncbi:MAG: cytidylate kinase family protein, partial [Clostridia bacterium]|nr:cytidylate kinase family protein [Clostridia bacterium]
DYGYEQNRAHKLIKTRDKTRARHYNYYCDRLWGDRKNYHLLVNSSAYGIDKAVDLIIEAAKTFYGE